MLSGIPASALETFESELGDRAIKEQGATLIYMQIPQYAEQFTGEAGILRRQALSRAIDRATICKNLFFGTRTPATDFIPPAIKGGGAKDIPGAEILQFDAAQAKELWKQAEAISPFQGKLTMAYSSDGPNKDWVEAVLNSIKNVLGLETEPQPYPTFGEFKKAIANQEIKGPFRQIWIADYPSPFNFLFPLWDSASADGKGSNQGNYKNPEVDQLLTEAQQATDDSAALEKYKAVEAILLHDLPAIPLWYQSSLGGYGEDVSDVKITWNGSAQWDRMVKK